HVTTDHPFYGRRERANDRGEGVRPGLWFSRLPVAGVRLYGAFRENRQAARDITAADILRYGEERLGRAVGYNELGAARCYRATVATRQHIGGGCHQRCQGSLRCGSNQPTLRRDRGIAYPEELYSSRQRYRAAIPPAHHEEVEAHIQCSR